MQDMWYMVEVNQSAAFLLQVFIAWPFTTGIVISRAVLNRLSQK